MEESLSSDTSSRTESSQDEPEFEFEEEERRIMPSRVHKSVSYSDNAVEEEEEVSEGGGPKASSNVQRIFAHRETEKEKEYFVKFKHTSYRYCEWVPESQITCTRGGKSMVQRYNKKYSSFSPQEPYFPSDYTVPEKVIGTQIYDDVTYYIVKWKNLDYDENTLEPREEFIEDLIGKYLEHSVPPTEEELAVPPRPPSSSWRQITVSPVSKSGKTVRPYQLEGLNFFAVHWYHRKNAILADEMGLGKTCQGSIFLNYLHKEQKIRGPYLVLAPLSTIPHWEREIEDWTDLTAVAYYGSKARREGIKTFELFYDGTDIPKFNVLITTYEYAIKDAELFEGKFVWQCMIVDEAHRLKNFESRLTQTMHSYASEYKLLLTGTPLQNNTQELWSLLNFLDEQRFHDMQDFQDKFGQLSDAEQISRLQDILHPLMLRRLKGDVEKNLQPLEEVIIECGMTQHQRAYYKSIYTKNMEYLTRGAHQLNSTNLQNIFMELRKVCNHPYLITGAEEQILIERKAMQSITEDQPLPLNFVDESLIRTAGKMILLDKLLLKLKNDGHRVLIFSQMTRMLDILSDFLTYRHYKHERLDGSVKTELRQESIDRFNAPESEDFVFLLCTKAGGLGINLTSADTVVIYDSDWNPQNDIQATARCHRIGQTKNVKVYRFLTAKSYERKMFDTAALKLGLDHAVLEAPKQSQKGDDMEKLLRLGAYYAFEEDEDSTEKFNEDDIDTILSRSKTIHHGSVSADGSSFSKAEFEVAEKDEVDVSAPDFWKKYMPTVKEDDIYEGISIADRKRMQRELSEDRVDGQYNESAPMIDFSDVDNEYMWSKRKITALQKAFLMFGWGRWHSIFTNFDVHCDIGLMKSVCHVFLKIYLDGSEEKNSLVKHLYDSGTNEDSSKFENNFYKNHKEDLMQLIGGSIPKKINRVILLYFLNCIVSSCPNAPDGLEIPTINAQKPAEWWNEQDDKNLIYQSWNLGYQMYPEMKFSNEEQLGMKSLNKRLKFLINGIKKILMKHSDNANDGIDLTFNKEAFTELKSKFTKQESRQIQNTLCNFGYPSIERFYDKTGLISKPKAIIESYTEALIKYCDDFDEKKEQELGILVEHLTLGQTQRVKRRIELFKKARQELENPRRKHDKKEKRILELFDEHGYYEDENNELIELLGGAEGFEGKITKKITSLTKPESSGSSRGNLTLHSFSVPEYEKDEDGNPIFPIKANSSLVINSMGTVVYDRQTFHNDRYLYPDGFETEKNYQSCLKIGDRIWYKSSIHDNGGDAPVFRVEVPGSDIVFEGAAPSKPWLMVIKAIEDRKKEAGIPGNRSLTISGPEAFGLTNPVVIQLMRDMPGVEKCKKYKRPILEADGQHPETENTKSEAEKSDIVSSPIEETKKKSIKLSINPKKPRLVLRFSKLIEESKSSQQSVSIPSEEIIQEPLLSVPIDPEAKDTTKSVIENMSKQLYE